jgi:hypothetical protein
MWIDLIGAVGMYTTKPLNWLFLMKRGGNITYIVWAAAAGHVRP